MKLIEKINSEALLLDGEFSIIIINDASTENKPAFAVNLNNLKSIKIVNMKENKGHAKCNATGLKYINEKEDFDYVIPMDGDGEDKPEELSLLFNKAKENLDRVVVATRFKRSEDLYLNFFIQFTFV